MIDIEITIPIASQWPTRDDLKARNAVEANLVAAGIGLCSGAGGGMGQMHLTYRVNQESEISAARAAIDAAMKACMPVANYEIKVYKE